MSAQLVYGIHAVEALLARGSQRVRALWVSEKKDAESSALRILLRKAHEAGVVVLERPKIDLDRLTQNAVHQGLVALCGEYGYASLAHLLTNIEKAMSPALVLLLDSVTDPQNLGALIRSAYVLGAHGLVIPQDRSASVTPAVIKTACGATEWLPILQVPNLVRVMGDLKEAGLWMYGTVLQGSKTQPPWNADFAAPTGLVLGSEGAGLRPLVQKTCDAFVHIPMQSQLQGASLNVSACGATLLYEALRQRTKNTQSAS